MKREETKKKGQQLSFAALYPFKETNEILPTEKEIRGQGFLSWGEDNQYPFYLLSLYKDVATL